MNIDICILCNKKLYKTVSELLKCNDDCQSTYFVGMNGLYHFGGYFYVNGYWYLFKTNKNYKFTCLEKHLPPMKYIEILNLDYDILDKINSKQDVLNFIDKSLKLEILK